MEKFADLYSDYLICSTSYTTATSMSSLLNIKHDKVTQELSADYHVIAPDYIGFGNSSQPSADSFDYTFDNLASYVDGFISALSLNKFIIIFIQFTYIKNL
jgi:pimeloyl-ACP methyl ester carboxylesterase